MRAAVIVCTTGLLSVSAVHALRDSVMHRQTPPLPDVATQVTRASDTAPSAAAIQVANAVALQADRSGHFHVEAVVDGRALRMMVDTGATVCVFSEEDAARIGIPVGAEDFTRGTETANGTVRVAPVRIGMIRIGPVTIRDVDAIVIPRGRLSTSLLGMSFLRRVREFSIAGGAMTLRG